MSQTIKLLLLSSLSTIFIYGIDLNSTNEIITNATQATKALEIELDSVINDEVDNVSIVLPMDMVEEKREGNIVVVENNSSIIESEPKVIVVEENSSLSPLSTDLETNRSKTIEDKKVSVERGDPRKGKNIFKYVLKEDCNMTAFQFAEKHTQEEWIEILEENKIKETLFETCPNVEKYYQDKWTDDLYQFFYKASNEDEIPEC